MKTAKINLYKYSELVPASQAKAIEDHSRFLDSEPIEHENESGEMIEKYHEHTDEETKESILINEYYFFSAGKLADVTTYTGKHELSGKTFLSFEGQNIEI